MMARAAPAPLTLLVEARINGAPAEGLVDIALLADDCTQIAAATLKRFGLYSGDGEDVCLQSVDGIDHVLDRATARLDIYAARPPPRRRVTLPSRQYATPLTGLVGGYGLTAQRVEDQGREDFNAFGDLSLTLHAPHGRLQNDVVAIHAGGEGKIRRLQTVYERDFPARLTRLSIGDTFTRAPRWGRIGAIGGVQYGTDFSMDPDESWRPYRTFQALLRQQAEVNIRVNGVVRQKQSLQPGYSSFDISPEAGLNDVEVIINEASGLTRIEDYAFFSSPESLGAGVTGYSFSLGVPRHFTGVSSHYEDGLVANGFFRHGVTDALTAEAYSELGDGRVLVGGGGQLALGRIGMASLSSGLSRNRQGRFGHVLTAGFERNTRRSSLQIQARLANPHYMDAVSALGAPFPDRSIRAAAGIYTFAGSFRAAFVEEADKVLRDRRFLSLEWEKPLRNDRYSLSASAYRDFGRGETGLAISLRAVFGPYSAGAGYQSADGRAASNVQFARSRQPGDRMQWSVRAADGGAGAVYQGDVAADLGAADLVAGAGVYGNTRQAMAGLRGGFAVLPGRLAFQKPTTGSSTLVEVPALEGVPVYRDNRVVAVTGKDGRAVIPDIRPYEVNTLRLRPEDIPLDYEVADFQVRFVPRRGVSEVGFDVRLETALAFTVLARERAPLPPGSRVELAASGLACPVGLEGRVYCALAGEDDAVVVTLAGQQYSAPVPDLRAQGIWRLDVKPGLKMAGVD